MTFLVCGEALFDLFATETPGGFSFDARIGGSPFNVAVGMARLGADAALYTGLSTDFMGRKLLKALQAEGVSTRQLVEKDAPTTLGLVGLGPDGGAAYQFLGQGAADRVMTPHDLPELHGFSGFHFGSFSLVVEPTGGTLLTLARQAGGRGYFVSVDPNVRPTVEPDLSTWRGRVREFVSTATLVKVSSEDIALLYPNLSTAEVAATWRELGAKMVIVTHGADGAEAWWPQGHVRIEGRQVAVVDTVGAGDTFQAALLAGLDRIGALKPIAIAELDREQVTRLMIHARNAAAVTCSRRGADMPRSDEFEPF